MTAELSVIIPSVNDYTDLQRCLMALQNQKDAGLEVIVVDRIGEELRSATAREFPDVVVLPVAADTTIPQMRAEGIARATAPAVGVIEDHVLAPPGWAKQMLDSLAQGNDVVGGSIENAATETLIDWAAFLCEYSGCIKPLPAGESTWLPGNNIVYRESVLANFKSALNEGRWENHLHDAMRGEGIKLIMRPEIEVGHKMHYTFGLYFSQRYLYARSFAGGRVQDAPKVKRLAYGAAALLLPPLLFVRTVRKILSKGRHKNQLVKSVPLLACFVVAWGWGEMVGAWFGPGNALSRVR